MASQSKNKQSVSIRRAGSCNSAMKKNTLFQQRCQKALQNLSESDIEKFRIAKDEETRLKIIFEYAKTIPIDLVSGGKSLEDAQKAKVDGNAYFLKKNYNDALKAYNTGILKCPHDTEEALQLMSILIANRSATFFEEKEYKRVFNDIDYLLEIGKYPQNLQHKIWLRKARCYDALHNERSSSEAYTQAIDSLKALKLSEKELTDKINQINTIRLSKPEPSVTSREIIPHVPDLQPFAGGSEYIAAHANVTFDENQVLGRFARAAEDIETGTTIVEESPHCAVLDEMHSMTNCHHCMQSVKQPRACSKCAYVVFCSPACEMVACRTYHRFECGILPTIFASGASINCLMALRIVTQKTIKFFRDKKSFLRGFMKDNGKKSVPKKRPYRSDDYDTIFFLCRNELLRKKEELVHYGSMAIYLLSLLKTTNYFESNTDQDILADDEQLIGSLILRHLQILQFNAHEVSELNNVDITDEFLENDFELKYKSENIGAAVYPTLALFNHSCDPSIVRYNIGNKVVVRTIKPIKSGDIIYENYGPIYSTTPKKERQGYLQERYCFECLCTPCVELWSMLEHMKENELRIPCKTSRCPYVFVLHKDDYCPFMECDYCKQTTSLMPFLKGLMILQEMLPRAEDLYAQWDYNNALTIYIGALNILYQFTTPPCPDMVKVQQRIRTCMVHFGNKAFDYVLNKPA